MGRLSRLASDWRLQVALGMVVVGLAVCVGVAFGRRSPRRSAPRLEAPALPEAHPIWDSWRAAKAGDVDAHLACFTAQARERLEAKLERDGREAFRDAIQAAARAALGVELGPPKPTRDGGLSFPVTVQHGDHAELLEYTVARTGGEWKVRAVARRGRQAVSPPHAERLGPPGEQGGKK